MRRVGLLEACDDAQLLGAGITLWPRQREILGEIDEGARMHCLCLGRRSGKSTMMALAGLHSCLFRPELLERLRPGERGYAVAIATNIRQARLVIQAARSIVLASPMLAELLESENEDELRFSNGTAFAAFACTSRSARGWPVFFLALDEAAFFVDSEGCAAAEKVFAALTPSLAQFGPLGRIVVSSTPWGSEGFFAELFQRAASGELEDARAHRATSAEMNPTLDDAFLRQEEQRDPESFKAEFLAEFLGSGGAFLDSARITEAVADRGELPPEAARRWICGLDPAFSSDPFGVALVGRSLDRSGGLLLGLARSWTPARRKPDSFEERRELEDEVLAEVAELCRFYGARAVSDQFCAPAIVDRLRQHGVSVETIPMTAATKTAAFTELRARLYGAGSAGLELYEHPELLAELRRLRTRYSAGSASVINPRVGGSHGDMAQALALAVYEHDRHGISRGTGRWRVHEQQPALARLEVLDRVTSSQPVRRTPRWYDRGHDITRRVF